MIPLAAVLPVGSKPVCQFCREGHPLFPAKGGGVVHERVAMGLHGELVREVLGPCSSPPAALAKTAPSPRPRTEAECRARLAEIAGQKAASRVLAEARETYSTLSEPREEDDDADS